MKNKYLGQLLHSTIILLDALIKVANFGEVRTYIEDLAKHFPNCKKIFLLVVDTTTDQVIIHHGIGWPAEWSAIYLREELHHVDPVMKAMAGKKVIWSELLASPTPEANLFLTISRQAGMTHGVSWSEIRKRWRITLDLAGVELEHDELAAQLLESIMPSMAEKICQLLDRQPHFDHLSDRDCRILQCMIEGKTDVETGKRVGLSERSVREIIKTIRVMYNAESRCHLLKILFDLSFYPNINNQN